MDFLLILGIVALLVYKQYDRIARVELHLYGAAIHSPGRQLGRAMLIGAGGGVLATLLFVLIGIPLNSAGLWFMWIVALLLALLHPRFMCFSYAGGLVSLTAIAWGWPQVNVPAIMALVAVLHLVEAVLVCYDGASGATPVYFRLQNGGAAGGFLLQRFWPLPLVALVAVLLSEPTAGLEYVATPDWWPLIHPGLGETAGAMLVFGLIPMVAALGYSDLVLTCRPAQKARRTAGLLAAYSLLLLLLAAAAQTHLIWRIIAALFAMAGHEAVIASERQRELTGTPLFTTAAGAQVLATLPGSPAQKMGLACGDVIRSLNGTPIGDKKELAAAMEPWVIDVQLQVRNAFTGRERTLAYRGKVPPLGVLLAPDEDESFYIDPYRSWGWGRALLSRWERWKEGRRR